MNDLLLEMHGVTKSFLGPKERIAVLRGVELSLFAGESLSIRGESGSGKTTLLNVLTQLERLDQGRIVWEGELVEKKSNAWLAKNRGRLMGLVFQGYYLIPELGALDNVLMARRLQGVVREVDRRRARDLMERVGLAKRFDHLPSQLSGGESQRIAIARALMNSPRVVIADEPTGNLDEETGDAIMAMLLELCDEEQMGLILVTHNPRFAAKTSKKGFLTKGKLEIV